MSSCIQLKTLLYVVAMLGAADKFIIAGTGAGTITAVGTPAIILAGAVGVAIVIIAVKAEPLKLSVQVNIMF